MAANTLAAPRGASRTAQEDPWLVRWTLVVSAAAIIGLLIIVPVVNVFYEALAKGTGTYWHNLVGDPDTVSAILLTLTVAPVAVALNTVFGLAAAWAIARFRFRGRSVLISLIDLPFAVSPVVAGLIIVLIFGLQGLLGPWLREHNIKIIFATPGHILATAFVTFPFVARELIPLMEAVGAEEEVAAVSLGARAWQLFRRITLRTGWTSSRDRQPRARPRARPASRLDRRPGWRPDRPRRVRPGSVGGRAPVECRPSAATW